MLQLKKGVDALSKHVDEEDKTTVAIRDTGLNCKPKAVIINESGLYSLVLSSKLSTILP
ncbi:MAG: BRO family protein [Prevotella sp.]